MHCKSLEVVSLSVHVVHVVNVNLLVLVHQQQEAGTVGVVCTGGQRDLADE